MKRSMIVHLLKNCGLNLTDAACIVSVHSISKSISGDWEEEHEKLAGAELTHDSGFDTAEKTYKDQQVLGNDSYPY